MRRRVLAIASSLALLAAPAFAAPHTTTLPPASLATAAQLRDQALADDTGWKVVESLTTEIGPRIAGSEADARAVAWAEAKFKALGFDKVWKEPVTFPKWERRSEHAAVTGKNPQPLQITALGGSPGGTVEAEVVRFADLAALQAAPASSLKGRSPSSITRCCRSAMAATTAAAVQSAARDRQKRSARARWAS